jgi:hypothetical protein
MHETAPKGAALLQRLMRWLRVAAYSLGMLLTLLFASEAARLFLLLRRIHPMIAYLFLATGVLGGVALAIMYVHAQRRIRGWRTDRFDRLRLLPRRKQRAYAKEMAAYIEHLEQDADLDQTVLHSLAEEKAAWLMAARHRKGLQSLSDMRRRLDQQILTPCYRARDLRAARVITEHSKRALRESLFSPPPTASRALFARYAGLAHALYPTLDPKIPRRTQIKWTYDAALALAQIDWPGIQAEIVAATWLAMKTDRAAADRVSSALFAYLFINLAGRMLVYRSWAHRPWVPQAALAHLPESLPKYIQQARDELTLQMKPYSFMAQNQNPDQVANILEPVWAKLCNGLAGRLTDFIPVIEEAKNTLPGDILSSSQQHFKIASSKGPIRHRRGLSRIWGLLKQRMTYDKPR